jgi:hypothetical protein
VTRRILAVVVVALALVGAGCSGDDDGRSSATTAADGTGQPLRIDAMQDAVDAVETALGGEQRYYEVNATPTLVNLFVAGADGTETSYVFDAVEQTLGEAVVQQPTMTQTFAWSQVDFDADTVLIDALGALPSSLPRLFSVTAGADDALFYVVTLESTQGGILDVLVDRNGEVLSTRAS